MNEEENKPSTLFAVRISRTNRTARDMWHLFLILMFMVGIAVVVMAIQYAFCSSMFPKLSFQECMTKNLFEK